jgi:methylenetetrahydrofolate reductase (NADPH)
MPIKSFSSIKRFSARCGASIPEWLEQAFDDVEERSSVHAMIAAGLAAEQCRRLVSEGLEHLHLYCLNDAALTSALTRLLLKTPAGQLAA